MASRPHDPTDPRHLTPDQILDEVSALLATGVRRLLALRAHPPVSLPLNSPSNGLADAAELSVHASRPVNATREPARS